MARIRIHAQLHFGQAREHFILEFHNLQGDLHLPETAPTGLGHG